MADGSSTDPMAATGANEPSKAELARAEFAAAIAATTASVEALMVGEGELTSGEKYALCRSIGEECIQEQELFNLLDKKPEIIGTYSIAGSLAWGWVTRDASAPAPPRVRKARYPGRLPPWGASAPCRARSAVPSLHPLHRGVGTLQDTHASSLTARLPHVRAQRTMGSSRRGGCISLRV